ncbi:MAG TPA: multicopper oxidase domain-containing protein, partial [Stenomitos sp.]
VGDTVHVTFTNRGSMPHSIDFHAARTDWKTSFRTIPPGKSLSFTFRPQYAGAFLYHCGTPPVLLHIGSGMYGALIVDPIKPLPKARELVLVYSEFYLRKSPGVAQPDYAKMLAAQPDYAAFNGRAFQYQSAPIHVKRGERVRIYLVNAGPRRECAFHIIGQQFDTVYPAAPPEGALHGLQTYAVPPGGGAIFDLQADQAGTFPFVNHDVGHGDSGAIGLLDVRGAS